MKLVDKIMLGLKIREVVKDDLQEVVDFAKEYKQLLFDQDFEGSLEIMILLAITVLMERNKLILVNREEKLK